VIYFNCEFCGKEKQEPLAWHKKRKKHFCSRDCASKSQLNLDKIPRAQYEKEYWNRPENKTRRKEMSKKAYIERMAGLGESYVKSMLSRCKARAILKGLEFNLTVDDIFIPEFCPVFNVKLELNQKQGGGNNSPALDRIDNSKGYIKGNVQVISSKANRIKSDATIEEIGLVYKFLLQFKE
jgi:hypothetical protein